MGGWQVVINDAGEMHVVPVDDQHEHINRPWCFCRPRRMEDDYEHIWVHHSWDGRELSEPREDRQEGWALDWIWDRIKSMILRRAAGAIW